MIVRAAAWLAIGNAVVPGQGSQEAIGERGARPGRILIMREETRAVRQPVQVARSGQISAESRYVLNIEHGPEADILLHAERDVVVVGSFQVAIVPRGAARRK